MITQETARGPRKQHGGCKGLARKKREGGGTRDRSGRGTVSSLGGLKVMYVRPWAGCGGLTRPLSNNCRQERTEGNDKSRDRTVTVSQGPRK